jgi:hypothetical protein
MAARLGGRTDEARTYLSPAGLTAFRPQGGLALNLAGIGDVTAYYLLGEQTERAGRYSFTYRVHQVGQEVTYATYWDETLSVTGRGGRYAVDGASLQAGPECFVGPGLTLFLRTKDDERRLFGMDDLPDEFTPQGAPADFAMGIGKEGFVLVSFSPTGDRLSFVTWGTHGFLGLLDLPQGKPQGIDAHWEGVVVEVRWSPVGDRLAAVIDAPTGNLALAVYELPSRQKLSLGLTDRFPPGQYSLREPLWASRDDLTFAVEEAGGSPALVGRWRVNVVTRVLQKETK